jgi:hypothetical protein
MISIENECLDELKYNNLIEEFFFKKYKKKLFSLNKIVLIIKHYNWDYILPFLFFIFYFLFL